MRLSILGKKGMNADRGKLALFLRLSKSLNANDKMKAFKSWQSYYQFESAIKYKNRYIPSGEIAAFLQTVLETTKSRIECLPKDYILWRAQLGHDWRFEDEEVGKVHAPHEPERMCPKVDRANEGRANPKGIPCLYLASNRETALAEVRPWIGSYISVGQFKIVRRLKIVNFATEKKDLPFYIGGEPSPKKREEAVWFWIDKAFAKPVNSTDDVADYAPTQVLSEFFKSKDFDGIGYRSSLGDGYNVALFDIHSAEIINCFLYAVNGIKLDSTEVANPYYLSKHYKKKECKNT